MKLALTQTKLSDRDQILLFAAGMLALLSAFFFLVYRPSTAELAKLHSENELSRQTLGLLEEAQRQHTSVITGHASALQKAAATLSMFPRESDLPAIMAAVDNLARSRGAKTELVDYAQVQWDKGLGRIQVTALFSGPYAALASTVVDLPRLLPSAHIEQVRYTAQSTPTASASVQSAPQAQNGTTPVAAALSKAFGLTNMVVQPDTENSDDVSPLQIDHLEVQVVTTIYLTGGPAGQANAENKDAAKNATNNALLEKLLGGQGQWYVRSVERWQPAAGDPFHPSARALSLVSAVQVVERYKHIRVNGLARVGSQWAATVEFMGATQKVKAGDTLGEAKVSRVDSRGVTLEIMGRFILINLGGEQD